MSNKIQFKTKEEFILALMAGRKFRLDSNTYYYDILMDNPFRIGSYGMRYAWQVVLTKEFTEIFKPRTEERWRMLLDSEYSTSITVYVNQQRIDSCFKPEDGWYKGESITVILKDN